MIVGISERFAIEAEIEERVDGWLLGHLRLWICGQAVGDWSDSVDLLGCLRWLQDFADEPRERYEPGLFELPKHEVFRRLYDPVMERVKSHENQAPVPDAFSRFHISYIGMSAFERFDILLLTNEHDSERCLWREAGSDDIHECYLWRREMERVAGEFCGALSRGVQE